MKHRVQNGKNEIAYVSNANKLLGIVIIKKPILKGLKKLCIPNIGRELIQGVAHTVEKCLLKNIGIALVRE